MKTFKALILLSVSVTSAFAYIPSVESLFRNSGNAEIQSNTTVINLKIKKLTVEGEKSQTEVKPIMNTEAQAQIEEFQQGQYKLLYTVDEKSKKSMMVQVSYTSEEMKNEQVDDFLFFPTFKKFPETRGVDATQKGLFYSLMNSLALNDGFMMVNFLRSRGVSLRYNEEIINGEKVKVLNKYKDYLRIVKNDKELKETIPSPLNPTDEEERIKVKEVLKQSFFKGSNVVKRIKKKKKFYWKVETENFTAFFENETRRLESLELQTTWGSISVFCKDYILFDGVHDFPKYVYYKDFTGAYFQIEMLSMKQFTSTEKSFNKRVEKYQESLNKNKQGAAGNETPKPGQVIEETVVWKPSPKPKFLL